MIFSPVKRSEVIPPCEQCSKSADVIFAFSTVLKISDCEMEMVPMWHCDRCNILFDSFTNSLANNQAVMKYVRFSTSAPMPYQAMTGNTQHEREAENDWKRRENETMDSPNDALRKIKARVSGFKLK